MAPQSSIMLDEMYIDPASASNRSRIQPSEDYGTRTRGGTTKQAQLIRRDASRLWESISQEGEATATEPAPRRYQE